MLQFPPPRKMWTFLAMKSIHLVLHPPLLPPAHPSNFFLSPILKKELACLSLSLEKFKTKWEGVIIHHHTKANLPGCSRSCYSIAKVSLYWRWIHQEKLENKCWYVVLFLY
jgi:hypothetical protein